MICCWVIFGFANCWPSKTAISTRKWTCCRNERQKKGTWPRLANKLLISIKISTEVACHFESLDFEGFVWSSAPTHFQRCKRILWKNGLSLVTHSLMMGLALPTSNQPDIPHTKQLWENWRRSQSLLQRPRATKINIAMLGIEFPRHQVSKWDIWSRQSAPYGGCLGTRMARRPSLMYLQKLGTW